MEDSISRYGERFFLPNSPDKDNPFTYYFGDRGLTYGTGGTFESECFSHAGICLFFSTEVSMYDTEKTLYRHYGYIQKETSLYARWFQKRGLSYPQFLILDAVLRRPEGAEPTALAEECFMPKQTVTGLLDQLERAGFIRRERCETDRRRTRVLSACGR